MGAGRARRRLRGGALPAAVAVWLSAAVSVWLPAAAAALPLAVSEYAVKAAFLYKFAKFVSWPEDALPPDGPLHLCVFGEDPFGDDLDRIVAGKRVGGHPIEVRRLREIGATASCHVVFLSPAAERRHRRVLAALAGRPVLTVGDVEGFAERGGIIGLRVEGGRIRIEINPAAASRAGLHIDAELLGLARLVGPESS